MPRAPRLLLLVDPTYAARHSPLLASVSDHQPSTWANFIFDQHLLVGGCWGPRLVMTL